MTTRIYTRCVHNLDFICVAVQKQYMLYAAVDDDMMSRMIFNVFSSETYNRCWYKNISRKTRFVFIHDISSI